MYICSGTAGPRAAISITCRYTICTVIDSHDVGAAVGGLGEMDVLVLPVEDG